MLTEIIIDLKTTLIDGKDCRVCEGKKGKGVVCKTATLFNNENALPGEVVIHLDGKQVAVNASGINNCEVRQGEFPVKENVRLLRSRVKNPPISLDDFGNY